MSDEKFTLVARRKQRWEAANRALARGNRTPLDVMIEAMNRVYDDAEKLLPGSGAKAAFPFAIECAPFVHPKARERDRTDGDNADFAEGIRALARFVAEQVTSTATLDSARVVPERPLLPAGSHDEAGGRETVVDLRAMS
jgi:hypothetical protein